MYEGGGHRVNDEINKKKWYVFRLLIVEKSDCERWPATMLFVK